MADGIAIRFENRDYTGLEERQLAAVLAMPGSALLARSGRRAGGGLEVTIGSSPESAVIAPGAGIINDPGAGGGSWIFVIPSQVTIPLATRPGAGTSRFDEVIAVIKNVDARPGDSVREVDIQVVTGGAAGSPTPPTYSSGALRLAELVVPASGSVSPSKAPQRTVALGGILPVANTTDRAAIEVPYDGLVVYREDTGVWTGLAQGTWVQLRAGDTGWADITGYASGFSGSVAQAPKKRTIGGNEAKLRGRINGTFAANTAIPVLNAGALPAPAVQHEAQISGNSQASSCRAYIGTDGSLTVVTGASAPAYVLLDGLSGYMLD